MTGGAEVVELNVGGRRRVRARTPPHNPPMGSYGAAMGPLTPPLPQVQHLPADPHLGAGFLLLQVGRGGVWGSMGGGLEGGWWCYMELGGGSMALSEEFYRGSGSPVGVWGLYVGLGGVCGGVEGSVGGLGATRWGWGGVGGH